MAETFVGDSRVSTVFLGLDHSHTRTLRALLETPGVELDTPQRELLGELASNSLPVVFETMIFGGTWDGPRSRYCTAEAARAGHEEMAAIAPLPAHFDCPYCGRRTHNAWDILNNYCGECGYRDDLPNGMRI